MERIERPYFPIIYVRGYAMTRDEIVETTSTPFMGFEAGSTKMRQAQDGSIVKFVFESPLVRLMKDYNYRDVYEFGAERRDRISPRCIVIHRYYDPADPAFGDGKTPSIPDAAAALGKRIEQLRDSICGNNAAMRKEFRVYLVAHSMGGLICRCLLQNPDVASAEVRAMVDKAFTYATPHNGIEVGGINLPNLLSINDINNFNRTNMGKYLKVPKDKVNTLGTSGFPPERLFCLIGTNSRDYAAAHGLSSFAVGALSDGLVRIAQRLCRRLTARLRQPQSQRLLRHRQFRGGLPEPGALPVRRYLRHCPARHQRPALPAGDRGCTQARQEDRVLVLHRGHGRPARRLHL